MSLTLLNDTDAACSQLARLARRLSSLERAFYLTGNEHMAQEMGNACQDLDAAVKQIKDAVAHEIVSATKQAEQSSLNVVSAVLAGSQLSQSKPTP